MKGWAWPSLRRGSSNWRRERLVSHTAGIPWWSKAAVNSSRPGMLLPRMGMRESTAMKRMLDVCRKQSSGMAKTFYRNSTDRPCWDKRKRRAEDSARLVGCPATASGHFSLYLVARLCCGGGRLRICLWDADVSADGVLAHLVHHDFLGNVGAGEIEEDRLVHGAIFLFKRLVFDGHGGAELVALFVNALQFDGDVADLLGFVPADDGEFNIVTLAQPAELVNFVMVACDECAHLAAGHFQVLAGGVEVGLDAHNLGVDNLDVIVGRLGGELGMDRGIERGHLLAGCVVELGRFLARFLQLALGNLEFAGNNLQVALKFSIGLFVLREAILQGRHILLNRLLGGLQLRRHRLLGAIELR